MKKFLVFILMSLSVSYASEMVKIKGKSFTREVLLILTACDISHQKVSCGDFLIADTKVTIEEYYEFVKSENRELPEDITRIYKPEEYPYHAIYYIPFIETIKFCNWKSRSENLEPCYIIDGDSIEWKKEANGYRLPTEVEWECAASNGWRDKKILSSNPKILKKYAEIKKEPEWKYDPSLPYGLFREGKLKQYAPNKNKLYDVLDNCSEFCWDIFRWQNYFDDIPTPTDDSPLWIERVVKSGYAIGDKPQRSSITYTYGCPEHSYNRTFSFRLARNID